MSFLDQLRSHWVYQLIARSKTVVLTGLQIASGLGALWRAGGLSRIRVSRASAATNSRLITSTTATNNSNNNNNNVYERSSHRINSRISTNLIEYNRKSSNSEGNNNSTTNINISNNSSSKIKTKNNNISETPFHTIANANQANNSHHRLNNKLNSALFVRKYHSRHDTVTGLGATSSLSPSSSSSSLMGVAFVRRPTTSMLDDTRILPTKILPASSTRLKSGIEDICHLPFMMSSKMTAKPQYTTHLKVDSVK
jgi:hypothetical protein